LIILPPEQSYLNGLNKGSHPSLSSIKHQVSSRLWQTFFHPATKTLRREEIMKNNIFVSLWQIVFEDFCGLSGLGLYQFAGW